MKNIVLFFILMQSCSLFAQQSKTDSLGEAFKIYQFVLEDIHGNSFNFSCLEGKKVMIVNIATKCMFAPQIGSLQKLYEKYKEQGFVIIGIPSNDFFNREPRSNKKIWNICRKKYAVGFPIMAKLAVKGDMQHPLYSFLSNKEQNGILSVPVKWNFHKYLIDSQGYLYKSINPKTSPNNKRIIDWIGAGQ